MNLMQYHEDSLKESLKNTMLNQENLFRKQVQELHRLYQIQMILMKNLRLKEVPTTQSLNYFKQDCTVDWSRYDQRPLDLEVPVSSYSNSFDRRVLNKGNGWGTRENPVEVEDYFHVETESSLEEAKLSLSIGIETSQRMSRWRSKNEEIHVLPDTSEVEESIGTVFSRGVELKPAFCYGAFSANTGERNGSWATCNCTNSTDKYLGNRARKFHSHRDESTNILENPFNLGNKKWLENLPETMSTVGEVFPSRGAICLDLNAHPDESFSDLKHSTESPGAGSWTKPNDNCSTQVSALLQHDTPSSVLIDCKRTDSMNPSGIKVCSIDLESYPLSPSNSSEHCDSQCKMEEPVKDVPSRNFKDENVMEVIVEKSDEVLLHSCLCSSGVEDVAIDKRSPDLSKSDHIAQDPSSSLKTMQSGTYLEKSFSRMNSFQNSDSSQVDSFAIGESKAARSSDEDNGGSAEDGPVIQKGAVSFIYFLLEARREHDSFAKTAEKRNEVVREKMDQPECSMDSFESTVLKLPECNIDDYCVSSNPYEINEMDKKDCGIKLRRGRRLKDFQKEILPSLPSLSRQEICEDIRIMEGAIRSREYKRYRSKVSSEQNWFTPVRSRRSRLNYIGRRCYK